MSVKFVKAKLSEAKKHNCPDCRFCQLCSDARCSVCRGDGCRREPLSVIRQIEQFKENNADDDHPPWLPLKMKD